MAAAAEISTTILPASPTRRVGFFVPLALLLLAAWWVYGINGLGRNASFTVLAGGVFGLVLQRARFCYFCIIREAIEERNVVPLMSILVAIGFGTLGALVIFGAWIPDATAGHLPPSGNIGPMGWPLVAGGIAFGLGMSLSGSCISAHFYRLAEGSLLAPVAIGGTFAGFLLGFLSWNTIYLNGYSTASAVWLPGKVGFAGAGLLQLGILLASASLLWRFWHKPETVDESTHPARSWQEALWDKRWPVLLAGLLIAGVASAALLRTEPIGVTSALGRTVRDAGVALQWIPERLEGLDGFRGCRTAATAAPLSLNALFVLSLIVGAAAGSFGSGQFLPERVSAAKVISALIGGILLGFGAMISLGCTVGRLYSGITALSLCGWVFALAMLAGIAAGLRLRRSWWKT